MDLDSVLLSQRHQSAYVGRGGRLREWRRLCHYKTLESGRSAHHEHPDRLAADGLESVRNFARPVDKSPGVPPPATCPRLRTPPSPPTHKNTRPPGDGCGTARQIPRAYPSARSCRTLHLSSRWSPSSASELPEIYSRRLGGCSNTVLAAWWLFYPSDPDCAAASVTADN